MAIICPKINSGTISARQASLEAQQASATVEDDQRQDHGQPFEADDQPPLAHVQIDAAQPEERDYDGHHGRRPREPRRQTALGHGRVVLAAKEVDLLEFQRFAAFGQGLAGRVADVDLLDALDGFP